ncbi:LuxR C-terminal-related transcriptional regulator, partial [Lutimonas sp.]|uniref:LuxR C-terminal-related transcriptional regulator n=1 Tax=Lutimonas sp. TaxID=1872403 RepID=UPI003D9B1EAC
MQVLAFLEEFAKNYTRVDFGENYLAKLADIHLSQTECVYVIDFAQNKMTFSKGFEAFLGYKDASMSLENYLQKIHPDDIDLVGRIGAATISHTHENPKNNEGNVLYLTFRIKNSKGEFIKVLSQSSVLETDTEGNMISSLIKVSDLSFIEDEEMVRYKFDAKNLDQEDFKRKIYGSEQGIFTERELDIIKEIDQKKTNAEIGQTLDISKHTVAT